MNWFYKYIILYNPPSVYHHMAYLNVTYSDSASLSPGTADDTEGVWLSGEEGGDFLVEHGLVNSETIELVRRFSDYCMSSVTSS